MTDLAFLALGSNVGDRGAHIDLALDRIRNTSGMTILACSDIEITKAVGMTEQSDFLNCIVAVRTALRPRQLLEVCHAVEDAGGRVREGKWGPRTMDVDVVEIEGVTVNDPDLVVPHPELANREFWKRELGQVKAVLAAGEI